MVRTKLRLLLPWSGGIQKTPLASAVYKLADNKNEALHKDWIQKVASDIEVG